MENKGLLSRQLVISGVFRQWQPVGYTGGQPPTAKVSLSKATEENAKMPNLRFVLTGGPGAGKTTVLEALAACGYTYVPESARALIRQRLAAGLSPRPPLEQFGQNILRMDISRYRNTPVTDAPVFFD